MMLNNKTIQLVLMCFFLIANLVNTFAASEKSILKKDKIEIQEPDGLQAGAYLIIGVFEYEKNALRMAENAIKEGIEAHYGFWKENGYYYVYTHSDSSKTEMIQAYHQIRTLDQYKDAWILNVLDTDLNSSDVQVATLYENEYTAKTSIPIEAGEPRAPIEEDIPNKKIIINFKALNLEGEPIKADIQLVDGKRANLIAHVDSDTDWELDKQTLGLDTIQIISQATGYQKAQIDLDILHTDHNTSTPVSHVKNDTIFVSLELKELEKGDFQVMYNTYFYGNSTVMRIQSKFELEEVCKMLSRNPNMRIKLHGHTNGYSRGKAYLFLEEKQNFFELDRTKEYEKKGLSSTKLSAYRAETIKSYLTYRGIASDRIETMGWGGKKMLYDSDSPMAKNNIRVEIEVLSK